MKINPHFIGREAGKLRIALLTVLMATISALCAAPVAINNSSFESATYAGANSWTNDLTDTNAATTIEWIGRDGSVSGQAFIERIGGFVSQGQAHVGMEIGYFVYQDTGVPWQANMRYTLTAGIGRRNDGYSPTTNQSVVGLTNTSPGNGIYANMAALLAGDPLYAAASLSTPIRNVVTVNGTFGDVTKTYDTGATPPSGTVVIVVGDNSPAGRSHFDNIRLDATSLLDPDGDTLPSDWETANGLNPGSAAGNDGATGDPDGDGSNNLNEFTRGTKPNDSDTDDDGALDGIETKTGILAGPGNIGTDPLKPDTDGDTLLDGAEPVNALHPTDPNKSDTDGDQFEDQAEIAAATNPSIGGQGSFPASTVDLVVGLNFIGGRVDGSLGASVTGTAGAVPQGNWNNLADLSGNGAALKSSAGADVIQRASWTVDDTYTVDTTDPADANAALMKGFLKTRKGVPTQVTMRNISVPSYDVYVYADSDGADRTADYTVNGVTISNVQDNANWPIAAGGGIFTQVTASNFAGNVVVFRNVTGPTLTITAVNTTAANDYGAPINAVQLVRVTADSDGDGMPNAWEQANGLNPNLNDAAADADTDGSTNLAEFQRNTNPQDNDSDDDSLLDGAETNTGVYVSSVNTGTNPLKADSDSDGFNDNIENNSGVFVDAANPGTNPNKLDTDGDGFPDGEEVTLGTNPVLASSAPQMPVPIGYWPFDDQAAVTADLSPGNHPGTVTGNYLYVAGHTAAASDHAIQFNGADVSVMTNFALMDSLSAYTMAGWVNFTVSQADRTGLWGANDTLEFGMISAATLGGWTPTGGQLDVAFGPSSNGWAHVAITDDGVSKRTYINGNLAGTGATGAPTAAVSAPFNIGGSGVWDPAGNFYNGLIDDVAAWNSALSATFIKRLAQNLTTPMSPASGLEFTNITVNRTTRVVTLTFRSVAGKTYAVDRWDETTAGQWSEITDNVAASTESTNYIDAPPANVARRLYRVRQVSP